MPAQSVDDDGQFQPNQNKNQAIQGKNNGSPHASALNAGAVIQNLVAVVR
jgi:hypothetical protein